MDYEAAKIEAQWKAYWVQEQIYKVALDPDKPKFYVLDMFPYPSGAGLHVGHPLGYVASDIFARYKRLQGYNVLHPMGYDAFGLPAEQYAIQQGVHPAVSTQKNMAFYRQQLDNLGFSFDWSRQINTSDPKYYQWTQAIFLQLFEHYYDTEQERARPIADLIAQFATGGSAAVNAHHTQEDAFTAAEWQAYSAKQQDEILMNYRLAYRKIAYVNWCEALGTVLANDEVKDGVSERGGFPVVRKPMRQWALRITAYAERLLQGLEQVEFSEALKTQQRNWIGRSRGAQIHFGIQDHEASIEIFTTRPDTIFGATFMVLAPEHELVDQLTTPAQTEAIKAYQDYASKRSERDRMADVKTVTGAFTGAYAVHPFTGAPIPIWIADYVLIGYGTGAIMAVPSNDERDARFAQKFDLPIVPVVDQSGHEGAAMSDKVGTMINSDFLNGLEVPAAIAATIQAVVERGLGQEQINYRLRDANFSRQRYWGEPFPIQYDAEGIAYPDYELPVTLPPLDNFKPTSEGKAPLARAEEWVQQEDRQREIDTMPGFAGSSWYFLRYMDPHNTEAPFGQEAVQYWQDVDLYVGGAEHAVGHLMYSRFWHKFMYDLGWVPTKEPYKKLVNQGMLQGVIERLYMRKEKEDGRSVFVSADLVAPEELEAFAQILVHIDLVTDYGKETSHLDAEGIERFKAWRPDYETAIFKTNEAGQLLTNSELGKISKSKYNVINPDDVVAQYGADCFRLYEMFLGPIEDSKPWDTHGITGVSKFLRKLWGLFYKGDQWLVTEDKPSAEALKILHTAIKKVNQDIPNFSFNTCVAHFMVAVNDLKKINAHQRAILEPLMVLMAPFAPFITEQLWHDLGHQDSIHREGQYPVHEEAYLVQDSVTYPVCINGKKRATATFPADATQQNIQEVAWQMEEIQRWIEGKSIRKVIVVPKRMVNIVV